MLTSKSQILDIKRCMKDPIYFIDKYIYFYDTQENKKINLKLWDFQREYASSFKNDRFVIALKSRQLGFTTVTLALALHEAIFKEHTRVVIIAQTEADAVGLLSNIKYMYSELPDFLRPITGKDSSTILEFPILNSSVEVKACSPKAGRSIQATTLILDEFAFYNISRKSLDEEIYTSTYPSISRNGKMVIISTPNGVGNMFHRLVLGAQAKENGFKLYKLMWDVRDDRDKTWYEQTLKALGPRKFAQEYECSFLQTGSPIFKAEYLKTSKVESAPISSHRYVVGADPAEGIKDGDYSAAYVFDLETLEQVEKIRGKWTPDRFAALLDDLGRRYNDALLGVERNNHGHTVLLRLNDLNYPNLYTDKDNKEGWLTTKTSKPIMINELEEALRKEEIRLSCEVLLSELRAFQDLGGGKMGAPSSCHDDCVMAMAIAYALRKAKGKARGFGQSTRKQLGL